MKTVYQCELCPTWSYDRAEVEACEAQGIADPALLPPIGLIVGDRCGPGTGPVLDPRSPRCSGPAWNNGKACGSHLCGGGFIWVVQVAKSGADFNQHEHSVAFGGFRGNGCGDTYDLSGKSGGYSEFAMGRSRFSPEKGFQRWQDWPEAQHCPAFWRAVRAVREAGLVARVIRNGEAVVVTDELPKEELQ